MLLLKSNETKVIMNWKNTDKFNKVRLIKFQGLHVWQIKQKTNGKWVLMNQLFENCMYDIPQKRKKQIIRMAKRGMSPKTIFYIVNKIHEQSICKKGITLTNVYKIVKPLRKNNYAKIEIIDE